MKCYFTACSLFVFSACMAETTVSEDWKTVAENRGLDEKAITQLEQDRILVTDEAYKQIFTAYLSPGPTFITSDSLLNAYHVLYEESIFRMENTNASRLPVFLRTIATNLNAAGSGITGNSELLEASRKRAKLVEGIARRLMDDSFRFSDQELDAILEDEVRRIEKGEGQRMPKWLGNPSPSFMGIDYNRYKPRGFYTRTEKLSRYFRALSWLQSIPFRISNDEELLAMLLLGEALPRKHEMDPVDYSWLLGKPDNLEVFNEYGDPRVIDLGNDDLKQVQQEYAEMAEHLGTGKINDIEPSFRILSAYQTPSAMLFNLTKNTSKNDREFPSGLELAVALGSDHARNLLTELDRTALLETIDSAADNFSGRPFAIKGNPCLYQTYLLALRALVQEPEPDAPDFVKMDAWKIKSINTLLGSWAQMRHTWSLQAKQSMYWVCGTGHPAGFVEPNPEFFARMANLAQGTRHLLQQSDALDPDYSLSLENLKIFEEKCGGFQTENEFLDFFHKQSSEDQSELLTAMGLLCVAPSEAKYGSAQWYKENTAWLKTVALDFEAGRIDNHPDAKRALEQINGNLLEKWEDFERISRQLEAVAHKQLRNVDLSEVDNHFIQDYGSALAHLMFYDGNSFINPRDDAPKIVDVYSNINDGKHLHVGIARARKIFVLYPWKGRAVLCTGAVLPYYEFVHTTRLNDSEWKTMLGSKKTELKHSALEMMRNAFKPKEPAPLNLRPAIPEWFKPIVNGNGLDAVGVDR